MAKYKIDWVEVKTSKATGKEYKRVTLTDQATNATTSDVAVFGTFIGYSDIQAGREVEGIIKTKDYQGKPSHTLESEQISQFKRPTGAIKEAQERKEHSIEKAQTNKELGIKVSSTMRDAVLIVTTIINNNNTIPVTNGDIKGMILEWRKWLWSEFDKDDKDFPPFN